MPNEEDEEGLLRSVALENAKSILFARQRAERALLEANEALELKTQELSEANRRLSESEALYRSALSAGRMGTWETDLVARTRQWTPEGMALFGINLPDGRGHVGGDQDEYWSALHPDDRHLVKKFHELADKQDSFTSEYRVVWPDGTTLWLRGHGQVVSRTADGKAHRLVSLVADETQRKAAEDHIKFLMHEISHRSKNLLTVIQSIARRTARTAATMKDFESRFGQRLQGLAASHDVLVRNSWQGAPLRSSCANTFCPSPMPRAHASNLSDLTLPSPLKPRRQSDLRFTNSRRMPSNTARCPCRPVKSKCPGYSMTLRMGHASYC